jgi:stalled ribosome rescue protein Dom34
LTDILDPEVKKHSVTATCSGGDTNALYEVLKRPELKAVLEKERASREAAIMEEIMHAISKEKAFYGMKEARERIEEANVKTIAVSETILEDPDAEDTEKLIEAANNAGAKVLIITTNERLRLDSLGGIAGIKRW